jgi:LacI family fructose operon transcriptional repressor
LITALPELTISQERKAGFEQAIASHSATRHLCEGAHFSRTEGYRLIKTLHQQLGQLPEALITTSYILMEGARLPAGAGGRHEPARHGYLRG